MFVPEANEVTEAPRSSTLLIGTRKMELAVCYWLITTCCAAVRWSRVLSACVYAAVTMTWILSLAEGFFSYFSL